MGEGQPGERDSNIRDGGSVSNNNINSNRNSLSSPPTNRTSTQGRKKKKKTETETETSSMKRPISSPVPSPAAAAAPAPATLLRYSSQMSSSSEKHPKSQSHSRQKHTYHNSKSRSNKTKTSNNNGNTFRLGKTFGLKSDMNNDFHRQVNLKDFVISLSKNVALSKPPRYIPMESQETYFDLDLNSGGGNIYTSSALKNKQQSSGDDGINDNTNKNNNIEQAIDSDTWVVKEVEYVKLLEENFQKDILQKLKIVESKDNQADKQNENEDDDYADVDDIEGGEGRRNRGKLYGENDQNFFNRKYDEEYIINSCDGEAGYDTNAKGNKE